MPENVALASKYRQAEIFFFRGYVRHFDRIITARLSNDVSSREIRFKGYREEKDIKSTI